VIVCSCNVLSDCQIKAALEDPASRVRTPGQVYRCLGCSAQCGRCARTIRALLDTALGAACAPAAACAGCPVAEAQAGAAIGDMPPLAAEPEMPPLAAESKRPLPAAEPVAETIALV
jgi:bacterioferritin-associated ferredoxin